MPSFSFPTVHRRFTHWLALLLTLGLVLGSTSVSYAEIPATISYQGVLTAAAGAVVPDGAYQLTFTLYNAGGTALWTETHANVAVTGGIFQVILGSVTSLAALPFDQPYQLGITVNNGGELTPRLPFTAVPYSLIARTLAPGAAVTSLNGLKDGVTLTAGANVSITPNGNTLTIAANSGGAGDGHSLDAADGSPVNALVVDASGQVGINQPAPAALLDVNGSTQLRTVVGIGGASPSSAFPVTVRAAASAGLLGFQDAAGAGQWHLTYGMGNGLNFAETGVADARLYLQDGGNVGIGTLQPNAKLDVNGNIRVANSVIGNGSLLLSGDATGGPDFIIEADGRAGVRATYGNVTFNVRGQFPEEQLFNVELSNGDSVFEVQADRDVVVDGDFGVINGSKNFIIDHPLDPANQNLQHNAVEGPGYYTFYHGNVVLDEKGEGWVQLPDYFEALNTEVSYNLTTVGGYAPVYVAQEVQGNRFLVAGGKAGLKVSWQVTANRNDPYAQQHPYQAAVAKSAEERGHYYYPEGYGQPETMSVSRINADQQPAAGPDANSGQ